VKRILPEFSTLDARAIVIVALVTGAIAWLIGLAWARAVAVTTLMGRRIADPGMMRVVAFGTAALGAAAFAVALLPNQ
jgi:nucleoside permease NupC